MNYFDDIKCTQVRHILSDAAGISYTNHEYFGIGMMLGKGQVRRCSPRQDLTLNMPFLYLIAPSAENGGSFWTSVNGVKRENRWFLLQGNRAEHLIGCLEENCVKHKHILFLQDYSELISIHKRMLHLYKNMIPAHTHRLSLAAEEFASAIYDGLAATGKSTPMQHLAEQTALQITQDPGGVFDFRHIAAKNNISYDHFRRIFRQYTGMPLHEFLLKKRLMLGRELLLQSRWSIKEISAKCGFSRQAEFARFIKEKTGVSPSDLRKIPEFDSL